MHWFFSLHARWTSCNIAWGLDSQALELTEPLMHQSPYPHMLTLSVFVIFSFPAFYSCWHGKTHFLSRTFKEWLNSFINDCCLSPGLCGGFFEQAYFKDLRVSKPRLYNATSLEEPPQWLGQNYIFLTWICTFRQ